MSDSLKTVYRFNLPYEAHLARGLLETEGIESFIADEFTVGLNWHITPALGGVRLQVMDQYLKETSEILNSTRPSEEWEGDIAIELNTLAVAACPKCGSRDIFIRKYALIPSIITLYLVFLPFPYPRKRYECNSCHNTWKSKK
jgi:Putative prokaryotic signal transducing protein